MRASLRDLPHMPRMAVMKLPRTALPAAVLLGLALLAACGGSKPVRPDEAMEAAEVAVGKAGAGKPVAEAQAPLTQARGKLDQARAALQASSFTEARRLAEQARADAELSIALNDLDKARTRLREVETPAAARPVGAP